MHVLTFAAAGSGRRPFETKQPELLLVLDGVLKLQLGQTTHTLQQGDAILLTAQPVTGWRNPAEGAGTRAVAAPPTLSHDRPVPPRVGDPLLPAPRRRAVQES